MSPRRSRAIAPLLFLLASSLAFACGPARDTDEGDLLPHGGGADGSSIDDDGGSAPSPAAEDGGASGFDVHPVDAPPAADDASCAAASEKAAPVPLDIFVMLDQSGSMKDTTSTGATKWSAIKGAFAAFMDDPAAAGIGVGLQYFGQAGFFGSGRSSCTLSDYAKAAVEIAPLPGVSSAIKTSLFLHSPFTDTPTGPAMQGALQHAREWQAAHEGHVVVVVLATDGLPTACEPQDIPSIAAFATAALAAKPSIRTFVIGVLGDADLTAGAEANLDAISNAGNGAPAFIIKASSADVEKSFAAALEKIRGAAIPCSYLVPTGAGADYSKVNVAVTSGGKTTLLPYVGSAGKCDPVAGGWYYDVAPSAGKPTRILTCDATCKQLAVDASGRVDIQVGCTTVVGGVK